MTRVVLGAITLTLGAAVVTGVALVRRAPAEAPSQVESAAEQPRLAAPAPPIPPDTSQGLRCIRAGATRDEVRRVMGEPDSIAFGDWLYGRSSVTFGYGVVLDFSNTGGDLELCP
jgi:hypothetical protein